MRAPAVLLGALLLAACGGTTPPPPPSPPLADAGHTPPPPAITWHRDVLPIVQARCLGCHVEGGIGPFALETYEQAAPRHASLADAVATRRMPPWTPDPTCEDYLHERRLTQAEIATLTGWSELEAPEGNPADAPAAPPPPDALPWVSDTLDPNVDYTPSTAQGPDDYHCFILDPELAQARDVIGFDIEPGVRRMVHHVLLYSATKANAEQKDAQTPNEPGWTCFGGPGTQNPQVVGGWVPGTPVTQYPEGTGIRLDAGTVLVMQIHYNSSTGPAVPDRTRVKLQYSAQPVPRVARIVPQAHATFAIPPQSSGYSVTTAELGSPVAVTLYGVLPHMHELGRRIRVEVAQTGQCLVDIPKWDFHWQQFYMLRTPVQLAAGQSRRMTCTWDNPGDQTVYWGEGTSEEMCLNYVYVTAP